MARSDSLTGKLIKNPFNNSIYRVLYDDGITMELIVVIKGDEGRLEIGETFVPVSPLISHIKEHVIS